MSDKSFTFLEIHLGDGPTQFGPRAIGSDDPELPGRSEEGTDSDDNGSTRSCPCPLCEDGCDCAACRGGKLLLVLAVLAGIAVVAWKLLGGDGLEAAEELDNLDDIVD